MIMELQLTVHSTVQCHFASTVWSYLPFLNNALIFILTAEVVPLKHPKNLTNGLLSDHFSHHFYKNSKRYGTMLYRKGHNILNMLHLTAYKYCSLIQQSKETIENSEICESNPSEQVRGDIMKEACYTFLYLNNKLYEMGSMLSEVLKNCDDLSDISFSDIMNHIEPTVWKFFTI